MKCRPKIQFVTQKRKFIRHRVGRGASELFQPHRRLTFECDLPGKTQKPGRSIEEPPDRSRTKGPYAFANKSKSLPRALRKEEWRRRQVWQSIDLRQEASGGLDWMLCRGIAASQRRTAQMSDTFKSFADAAHKDFSTPDAPIVAVAGTVEADSRNACLPLTALR